jgi:OPA family sugar phosphate sensor protein UhpC-like MFS transporter
MYMARYGINSWGIFFLQEGKGYSLVDAASAMAAYPIMGLLGAICSGLISDRFFGARRNMPTLLYGLLLVGSLVLLYGSPAGSIWMDAAALGMFGFAIGGLIVFLAGLIAVDILPKRAAGAAKGVIGLFSYLGAATQDWISGILIARSARVVDEVTVYQFDKAFAFWLGASIVSLLLALVAWNQKPKE